MKKINELSLILSITAMLLTGGAHLYAAVGDFGAWHLKDGHDGMSGGNVTFENKDLTLEFWLYIEELEGKNVTGANIISTRHDGSRGFSVNLQNNGGNVDIRCFLRNSTDQTFTLFLPRTEFSNKWGHLAFVISSTERKAYTYLNGELHGTIGNINSDWIGNHPTGNLNIGYWYQDAKFYGKLADIRIWNATRTAEEIKANYNKVLKGDETGLYVYYTFADFKQTITNDASPGRNNGTLRALSGSTWSNVHIYEVLAQKPYYLNIANDAITWEAEGESWEVEMLSRADNSVLKTEMVTEKSFSLAGLPKGLIIKVRTYNKGFYSAWAETSTAIKVACVGDDNTYGSGA